MIIRSMKEAGCPTPIFEVDAESVTTILPANPRGTGENHR